MPVKVRQFVGLYTGAAADGIDASLVEVRGRREQMKVRQIASLHEPYDMQLHRRIAAARSGGDKPPLPVQAASELDRDVAKAFATAACRIIDSSGAPDAQITAIGSSGQHIALARAGAGPAGGPGAEFSAGCPSIVAFETHLPVVTDFAGGDLASGGNGSAVTAWPNWLLFHDLRLSRVVLELGAIALLTFIPSGASCDEVVAFDVGPGTALLDQIAQKCCNCPVDTDGAIAAHGSVNHLVLNELLSNGYYHTSPPKASSPDQWGSAALWRVMNTGSAHNCRGGDLLATVTEMTARSIAQAVGALTERPHEVILSGGGAMNIHLAGRIRSLLSPCSTYAVEHYGISLRAHGAVCFAILAAARLDSFAAHCHHAGGAGRKTVLGSVTLP